MAGSLPPIAKVNDLAGAVNVNADDVAWRVEVHDHARGDFLRVCACFFGEVDIKRVSVMIVIEFHVTPSNFLGCYAPIVAPFL